MDIVRRQQQPGIFQSASRQHVEAGINKEFTPRSGRCSDMIDRSSGGF
jgi:hypothetical protein